MLLLEVLIYGFSLWLGLYLIARDLASPRLRLAGLGLVAYAFDGRTGLLRPRPAYPLFAVAVLVPLLWLLYTAVRTFRGARTRRPVGVLLVAGLFFALSTGLLVFPLSGLLVHHQELCQVHEGGHKTWILKLPNFSVRG